LRFSICSCSARRDSSIAAANCARFAGPSPLTVSRSSASSMAAIPLYLLSSSRARSTALFPWSPVRNSTARSSASLSTFAPSASSRSRGRSASGQSEIAMSGPIA